MKTSRLLTLWSALFLLLIYPPLQAQQPTIDLRLFNTNARVFFVGDLDPAAFGNAPNYFSLEMTNPGAEREVRIIFRFQKEDIILAEGESNIFRLPTVGPGELIFTNNQLLTGVAIIPQNGEKIELDIFNVNFDQLEELQSGVTSTGKLTAGRYLFYVALELDPPGGPLINDSNSDDNILIITNPTTIEPIYPGVRVNQGNLPEIPTLYPYFIWQSDADLFNLFVYRKYQGETIEDVLSRDPMIHLEGYPNSVYQYPAESESQFFFDNEGNPVGGSVGPVRILEPGFTYYWFVEARIPTTSDETIIRSDVYQFKITNISDTDMTGNLILVYLRQILGENYDQVMQQLAEYEPTGKILLNGREVDLQMLVQLIQDLNTGQANIQDLSVTN